MQYDLVTFLNFLETFYINAGQVAKRGMLWVDSYGYYTEALAIDADTATANMSFNVNVNADFWLTDMSYAWSGASALRGLIQMTDAGSARPFFNQPVPIGAVMNPISAAAASTVASQAERGRALPWPKYLSANTTVTIIFTGQNTAANSGDLQCFFNGVAVKKFG